MPTCPKGGSHTNLSESYSWVRTSKITVSSMLLLIRYFLSILMPNFPDIQNHVGRGSWLYPPPTNQGYQLNIFLIETAELLNLSQCWSSRGQEADGSKDVDGAKTSSDSEDMKVLIATTISNLPKPPPGSPEHLRNHVLYMLWVSAIIHHVSRLSTRRWKEARDACSIPPLWLKIWR